MRPEEWRLTLNSISHKSRILPTTLDGILLGHVSCNMELAERLERVTGIGKDVWRQGSISDLRAALCEKYPYLSSTIPE